MSPPVAWKVSAFKPAAATAPAKRICHDIAIAGATEGDRLLISVRDNGCGFDPDSAPGVRDGHFGLSGIRERLALLHGSLEFEHNPGGGMRAVITLSIPLIQDARE